MNIQYEFSSVDSICGICDTICKMQTKTANCLVTYLKYKSVECLGGFKSRNVRNDIIKSSIQKCLL